MILGGIALVVLAVLALIFYKNFTAAPTCSDNTKNQGEAGIDCGGPCPYLCTEQEEAPIVRFTQATPTANGETDVISYVDNPNQSAYAAHVAYKVSLYTDKHTLAAPIQSGFVDLPPGASAPVFIPNVNSGKVAVASAFLTLDQSTVRWQAGRDTRVVPTVSGANLGGTIAAPRITSVLTNPSVFPLTNVKVIVVVFDASGNAVSASQTIVPSIPGQGSATATFSWTGPFKNPPTRIDVLPIIPFTAP